MFVYTIQRAIELGFVSGGRYSPVVKKGYDGIASKAIISANGLLDLRDACDGLGVQRSYAEYINYPRVLNAKEAVGSFFWATTIVEKPNSSATADGKR